MAVVYSIDISYLIIRLFFIEAFSKLGLVFAFLALYDTLVIGLGSVVITLAILALVQIHKTKEAGKKFAVAAIVMVAVVWLFDVIEIARVFYYQGLF